MNGTTPALLAAAAGVGLGHAILPDHWVPMAVLGRTRRYPLRRVARLSVLAGIAHVLVSILLGGVIVAVGLQFRSSVQSAQDTVIGSILVITGLGFVALHLTGHGHHHDHDHDHHDHPPNAHGHVEQRGLSGAMAVMVPFGAAASPDLTILPVFLAATAVGTTTAVASLLIFGAVTIGAIVGLTLLACFGGYQLRGQWLERWGNVFTALILLTIGALVLTGAI
jgi:nickel/cobalt transporter (NicO) family protein